MPFD